jgi:tetratricopeptide (TPR) repeat protein
MNKTVIFTYFAMTLLITSVSSAEVDFSASILRACQLEARQLWGDALKEYDKTLTENPALNFVRVKRARVLFEMGRVDDCLTDINLVLKATPHDENANFEIARTLSLSGKSEKAIDPYFKFLIQLPKEVQCLQLAKFSELKGDIAEAERGILGLRSNTIGKERMFVLFELGGFYERRGKFKQSAECFEAAAKLTLGDGRYQLYQLECFLNSAYCQLALGNFEAAILIIDQIPVFQKDEGMSIPAYLIDSALVIRCILSDAKVRSISEIEQKAIFHRLNDSPDYLHTIEGSTLSLMRGECDSKALYEQVSFRHNKTPGTRESAFGVTCLRLWFEARKSELVGSSLKKENIQNEFGLILTSRGIFW